MKWVYTIYVSLLLMGLFQSRPTIVYGLSQISPWSHTCVHINSLLFIEVDNPIYVLSGVIEGGENEPAKSLCESGGGVLSIFPVTISLPLG